MENELIKKVAIRHLLKKVAPAAVALGLAGCADSPASSPTLVPKNTVQKEDPSHFEVGFERMIPLAKQKTDLILEEFRYNFRYTKNAKSVLELRAKASYDFDQVIAPYYKRFDGLSEKAKGYNSSGLKTLEDFIFSQRDIIFKKLEERYLTYKPHLKERYEKRYSK